MLNNFIYIKCLIFAMILNINAFQNITLYYNNTNGLSTNHSYKNHLPGVMEDYCCYGKFKAHFKG